jgi:hypothetical protein
MTPYYPEMVQNPYATMGVQSSAAHMGFTRPSHAVKENWKSMGGEVKSEDEMHAETAEDETQEAG